MFHIWLKRGEFTVSSLLFLCPVGSLGAAGGRSSPSALGRSGGSPESPGCGSPGRRSEGPGAPSRTVQQRAPVGEVQRVKHPAVFSEHTPMHPSTHGHGFGQPAHCEYVSMFTLHPAQELGSILSKLQRVSQPRDQSLVQRRVVLGPQRKRKYSLRPSFFTSFINEPDNI